MASRNVCWERICAVWEWKILTDVATVTNRDRQLMSHTHTPTNIQAHFPHSSLLVSFCSFIKWRDLFVFCQICTVFFCSSKKQKNTQFTLMMFTTHTQSPSVCVGHGCAVWMLLMAWCLQLRLLHQFSPVYRSWAWEVLRSDGHHQSSAPCLHIFLHPNNGTHTHTHTPLPFKPAPCSSHSSDTVHRFPYDNVTDSILRVTPRRSWILMASVHCGRRAT